MTASLPTPTLLRSFPREHSGLSMTVTSLRWDEDHDRTWTFPDGVTVQGPPPREFGFRIMRQGDAYSVRLVWNRTFLAWESLGRGQLLESCLRPLLAALGTDLWQLLDRPARTSSRRPTPAA